MFPICVMIDRARCLTNCSLVVKSSSCYTFFHVPFVRLMTRCRYSGSDTGQKSVFFFKSILFSIIMLSALWHRGSMDSGVDSWKTIGIRCSKHRNAKFWVSKIPLMSQHTPKLLPHLYEELLFYVQFLLGKMLHKLYAVLETSSVNMQWLLRFYLQDTLVSQ